jgi:hypothetical protein
VPFHLNSIQFSPLSRLTCGPSQSESLKCPLFYPLLYHRPTGGVLWRSRSRPVTTRQQELSLPTQSSVMEWRARVGGAATARVSVWRARMSASAAGAKLVRALARDCGRKAHPRWRLAGAALLGLVPRRTGKRAAVAAGRRPVRVEARQGQGPRSLPSRLGRAAPRVVASLPKDGVREVHRALETVSGVRVTLVGSSPATVAQGPRAPLPLAMACGTPTATASCCVAQRCSPAPCYGVWHSDSNSKQLWRNTAPSYFLFLLIQFQNCTEFQYRLRPIL